MAITANIIKGRRYALNQFSRNGTTHLRVLCNGALCRFTMQDANAQLVGTNFPATVFGRTAEQIVKGDADQQNPAKLDIAIMGLVPGTITNVAMEMFDPATGASLGGTGLQLAVVANPGVDDPLAPSLPAGTVPSAYIGGSPL